METSVLGGAVVWRPSEAYVERSRLRRFMREHGIADYDDLYRRSIEDMEWFWNAALAEMKVEWYRPYGQVCDASRGVEWARWFVGGKTNLAHNCLDKHRRAATADKPAIHWEGEDGSTRTLTYRQLHAEVCRAAAALRSLGVERGDRVALFLPMIPEVAVALLACAKIGAILTPVFSGFAADAVASRVRDCEAKVIVTADGFHRRGQVVPMLRTADAAAQACPSVQHMLVVQRVGTYEGWQPRRDVWWHEATADAPDEVPTEVMDAEDPFMIIYTSGTTGRPKGTVHVHAGFPIKAAQDMAFHFDVQEGDVMFWLTDMGWMMGPWEVLGVLALGATMVLYEGVPDHPHPGRLWELAARYGVTVLGIAPTAVRALMKYGDRLPQQHDLSSLRVLGSTGEPWNPEPYLWYFHNVGGRRCPIINYSGGTEISGGIVCGTVLHPCKPCSFAGPCLGIAADIYDTDGRPVRPGEVGELVITRPWPGMTRGFWRDPGRYLETYWSRWPGVWVHGDWAARDAEGFWYILGRSDDTIKIAGKRVGPAEVESALTAHPAVVEAATIGVPHEVKGEALVCFVVLCPGYAPSEVLREELRVLVADKLGKALRPEEVKFVADLPKTRNAKVMRRVLRAAYIGQDPGDVSSLENPKALEEIARAR
ncbi:MAG: acetate--CoA ligase [Armatimonadota bacterium]|nr:acetate--CoA ligase [Armatimonadota bacterium]